MTALVNKLETEQVEKAYFLKINGSNVLAYIAIC